MLKKSQIADWCNHPVTQTMLDLIVLHKANLEEGLREYVLNDLEPKPKITGEYKGQIEACNKFLDLKNTLIELSEEYGNEVEEDEVPSIRTESSSKS